MKNRYILFFLSFLVSVSLTSCNLEKEVEIDLPPYDSQPMVECYLEPGKPFRLLMTSSAHFFEPFLLDDIFETFDKLLYNEAEVRIIYDGRIVSLENRFVLDPDEGKLYNYYSDTIVPDLQGVEFRLEIDLPGGQHIFGETEILPRVPVDSIVVERNDAGKYRLLTYITDDQHVNNYYRRMLFSETRDSLVQNFTTEDLFADPQLIFGTGFEYNPGSTLINVIINMGEDYFRFYNSVVNAGVGGGPFIQPGQLYTNLSGDAAPLGIFTGLSATRDTTVIVE